MMIVTYKGRSYLVSSEGALVALLVYLRLQDVDAQAA
jgi:hypothetical protein